MASLALIVCIISLQIHIKFCTIPTPHTLFSPYHKTATIQYEHLNTVSFPLRLYITSCRPKSRTLAFLMILLCGDIHLNPGPSHLNIFSLNMRSLLNQLHLSSLHELIAENRPDIVALCETWVKPTSTPAQLKDVAYPGYTLISQPRPHSNRKATNKCHAIWEEVSPFCCANLVIYYLLHRSTSHLLKF